MSNINNRSRRLFSARLVEVERFSAFMPLAGDT
jgi:hypothetical protein